MSAKNKKEEILEQDEDLQEFKADGEKSEIEDPVGGKTPKRRGDKDTGDPDYKWQDDELKKKAKAKKSKPSAISDAVKLMGQMDEDELQELLDWLNGERIEEDRDEEDSEKVELQKITTDDVDVSEDVNAMFKDSEDLSEEFKQKATDIFETALVAKVNEILENAYVDAYSDKEALEESVSEDLSDKLDQYLDYVVNEWAEENQLAVDKGVYADLTESFMSGLKSLFEEHYIDIPEEKVDVVNELVERNDELEENINELTDSNIELFNEVKKFKQERVIDELSEDLTDAEKDKLRNLSEGVSFKDEDDFRSRVSMLKETYFGESDDDVDRTTLTEDDNHPFPVDEEEEVPAHMQGYVKAISRHAKSTKK